MSNKSYIDGIDVWVWKMPIYKEIYISIKKPVKNLVGFWVWASKEPEFFIQCLTYSQLKSFGIDHKSITKEPQKAQLYFALDIEPEE